MSIHKFIKPDGRLVQYGLDLPTGGYFFNEFYTDEEMENSASDDELAFHKDGMLLSKFFEAFSKRYGFKPELRTMLEDYLRSQQPTPMQYAVNKLFGIDLQTKLSDLRLDVDLVGSGVISV